MSTPDAQSVKVRLRALAKNATSKKPLWKEKWSVSLTGNEEFHITDKLLKLTDSTEPKPLCVLRIVDNELSWEQADSSADVEINGELIKMGRLKPGDRFGIRMPSEERNFDIEVIEAPEMENAGPVVKAAPREDSEPTLTIAQSSFVAGPTIEDGPSFTTSQIREVDASPREIEQPVELEEIPKPWMPAIVENNAVVLTDSKLRFSWKLGMPLLLFILTMAIFLGARWNSGKAVASAQSHLNATVTVGPFAQGLPMNRVIKAVEKIAPRSSRRLTNRR